MFVLRRAGRASRQDQRLAQGKVGQRPSRNRRFAVTRPAARAPLIVGVTSHRNLAANEIASLHGLVRAFFHDLGERFRELPLVVLSALAEGGDRIVAEEALACNARLIAVLPLPAAVYADDFVEAGSAKRFSELCARAHVLQMPLLPRNSETGVLAPGEQRDAQYAEAGVFISSHCHILLALWDGRDSDLVGGTAQIVRYHLDAILPGSFGRRHDARSLLDRGDESLVYHIACSRTDDEPGSIDPPRPPLRALEARWLCQSLARAPVARMPDEYALMFRRMAEFNIDMQRHVGAEHARLSQAVKWTGSGDVLDDLFTTADGLAIHFQKRVHLAMRGIHTLALVMGISFVAYSDLPVDLINPGPMIDVFVASFAMGLLLDRIAKRRSWHRKYIDYRALAEGLRVQGYWRRAGISAAGSVAFAHDNFMQKQDVELGWIRNVMRAAGLRAHESDGAAVATVIEEWIGPPTGAGQLGYYARKTVERSRVARSARMLSSGCMWIGMGIGGMLAVFHRWLDADTITTLVAVIGMLAIIAAVRESYAFRKADKELVKQYRLMGDLFEGAREALDAESDPDDQRDILRALGEAALTEHAEWALMHRERPLEHGKL